MTQRELQALAVKALGERATVRFDRPIPPRHPSWYVEATVPYGNGDDGVTVWHPKKSVATRALAAALRALAGEE